MENKRGQDLSIGTLILIVLGIVVLVLLILGFSMGWQDLFSKINIFSGGSNLESVAQACNLAASSNAVVSYCNDFKKVKINGETAYINCEYPDIQSSINEKLDCSDRQLAQNQCKRLIKQEYDDIERPLNLADLTPRCQREVDFNVNNVDCKTLCEDALKEIV